MKQTQLMTKAADRISQDGVIEHNEARRYEFWQVSDGDFLGLGVHYFLCRLGAGRRCRARPIKQIHTVVRMPEIFCRPKTEFVSL